MSARPPGSSQEGWERLHPVTPLIHGLPFLVVGPVALSVGEGAPDSPQAVAVALVVFAVMLAVAAGVLLLAWRFNEFRLAEDSVQQRKGLVFKQFRQARLDRLQAVDVVQPLVARIFGFAELAVEVAGGSGSGVKLQFLRVADAQALRNEILERAAGVRPARAGEAAAPASDEARQAAVEAPAREIYQVPPTRLAASLLLSATTVVILLVPIVAVGLAVTGAVSWAQERQALGEIGESLLQGAGGAVGLVLGMVGVVAAIIGPFAAGFNFTASIAADGIRLSHGLLDTRRQTVPPGRVQALRLRQHLLWRRFDWWQIRMNVAGYQDNQEAVSTLLPVGERQEALYALWLVLPDLGDPDPEGTVSSALTGRGGDHGFTPSPVRALWLDPFQGRRRGVRATERALLVRQGLLVRDVVVVPHERTQSLALVQGPLQRWLRLASVEVHSTNGPVRPIAQHLDIEDARRLVEAQAARAREGRARQTPEQWMAQVSA